jgi:hypothetical protein
MMTTAIFSLNPNKTYIIRAQKMGLIIFTIQGMSRDYRDYIFRNDGNCGYFQ